MLDKRLCPRFYRAFQLISAASPVIHPRRKRHRRRGKRGGWLVRVKTGLALSSMGSWTEYRAVPRLSISRRLLDPIDAWLVPVVGSDEVSLSRAPCSPRPRWRGVNPQDLRPSVSGSFESQHRGTAGNSY